MSLVNRRRIWCLRDFSSQMSRSWQHMAFVSRLSCVKNQNSRV